MNNKGFTLIELIGTITILAIIMAIAVPNVMSITRKNKNQTYINDARKMVTLAKYRFESDASIDKPTGTRCLIIKLRALDRSELQKGPENGNYDLDQSYVMVKYNSTSKRYDYSAQLVENYKENTMKKGVSLTTYTSLMSLDAKNNNVTSNASLFKNYNSVPGCSYSATNGSVIVEY